MKKWLITILFASVLVLGACGGGDDNAADEPEDNGSDTEQADENGAEGGTIDATAAEEVFQNNCSSCHGADLTGGAGPDLTKVGSRLSKEEIADTIENGKGQMPPGMAKGDDVDLLASWLAEHK